MYRQRKRDLNLKPNRQLDKRSSRGMIYENEELRMRTIAICEDVDKGHSDIKKLRKENDHLKREIWGLRDECEKLEEMLKRVCISANIPEIQLESSSKSCDDDDDDDDDKSSYADDQDDRYLQGSSGRRKRRESGTSVNTFDSEVGSCMSSMFGGGEEDGRSEDIAFAVDDTGSVINQPILGANGDSSDFNEAPQQPVFEVEVEQHHKNPVFDRPHPSWGPAAIPPDLEAVREETESASGSTVTSPVSKTPTGDNMLLSDPSDNFDLLPDPNAVVLSGPSGLEGINHPVIQITPASSPSSNPEPQSPDIPNTSEECDANAVTKENVHSIGCITVVPKTFKVTSEILVNETKSENRRNPDENFSESTTPAVGNDLISSLAQASRPPPHRGILVQSKSVEFPRRKLTQKQDSDPVIPTQDGIAINPSPNGILGCHHRRSCYLPSSTTLPGYPSTVHRSFGILGCCCNDLFSGYQSEPSLNSPTSTGAAGFVSAEEHQTSASIFNALCCRLPVAPPVAPPATLRSVWNTVDRNIVIGYYDSSSTTNATVTVELKVQEIIDELEAQFDHTLENITGIRLIPGRIFISLKNASVVNSFLHHFNKQKFILRNHNNLHVHFIEGCAKWSTLALSGIPQELSDLAVISVLNQFGQVVAPLERRNYKGVDISERIAKMHLVINETSVPEHVNVSGYDVRIRVEKDVGSGGEVGNNVNVSENKTLLKHGQGAATVQQQAPARKYGFVAPPSVAAQIQNAAAASAASTQPSSSNLQPHKPVIRSSSSAPRLETPAQGTLSPLPPVEAKRQSSICVGNIPVDQHPSKLQQQHVQSPAQALQQQLTQAAGVGASSTPNLQPPPKKPLARLLVSSPGSFTPVDSPSSPPVFESTNQAGKAGNSSGGGIKGFYRSFDPRRGSAGQAGGAKFTPMEGRGHGHAPVTPSSSYSPKTRRKSSVQFAGNVGRGRGKREPLPWCGCWGLGCG